MASHQYGGVAQSEAGVGEFARQGAAHLSGDLAKLKRQVLAGTVELSVLGVIGSVLMIVVSVVAFLSDFLGLSPVRALLMIYCFLGGLALVALEGIHRPPSGPCGRFISRTRLTLAKEAHVLTTLTGRALAYVFFASLLLADSRQILGKVVGCYLVAVGCAMLFVAQRASATLSHLGAGATSRAELEAKFDLHDRSGDGRLERAELASLCADLGTTLSPRELESVLALLDADQSGYVEKHEFVAWWAADNWQRSLLGGGNVIDGL